MYKLSDENVIAMLVKFYPDTTISGSTLPSDRAQAVSTLVYLGLINRTDAGNFRLTAKGKEILKRVLTLEIDIPETEGSPKSAPAEEVVPQPYKFLYMAKLLKWGPVHNKEIACYVDGNSIADAEGKLNRHFEAEGSSMTIKSIEFIAQPHDPASQLSNTTCHPLYIQ